MKVNTLIILFVIIGATVTVSNAAPTQESLTAFAQWVSQYKIHTKFNLGVFDGYGLGGVARNAIEEGEALIMVPAAVIISNNKVRNESYLKDFKDWAGVFAFEPTLAFLLIEDANPTSPYKPFLDTMPASFPTHPLSWTEEELAEAVGTALPDTTAALKEALRKTYDHLLEKLVTPNPSVFPAGSFTFEKLVRAYQIVNSRSWMVKDDEGNIDLILVPLADMLNHKPGTGVGAMSEDKTFFYINATERYEAGQQVFDNYGPKNNYELLSAYGFLLANNPDDSMTLHFSLKPSNLVHSIVEPLLSQIDPNYKAIKIRPNKVPVELLRVFRLSVMEFSELEYVADALQGKGVSLTNELRSFRAAIQSLTSMLQKFPTTIAEDKALLENPANLTVNQLNAIYLRKSQKEIITNVVLVLGKMWENILLSGELLGGVAI